MNFLINKYNMKAGVKICTAVLLILIYGCKDSSPQVSKNSTNVDSEINTGENSINQRKAAPPLKNLRSTDAALLIKEFPNNTVVLDVRTPQETTEGKIENAIEINYQGDNFKEEVAALDRSKIYLVHCKSGGRSSKAVDYMKSIGFTQCYNIEEGYESFKESLDSN